MNSFLQLIKRRCKLWIMLFDFFNNFPTWFTFFFVSLQLGSRGLKSVLYTLNVCLFFHHTFTQFFVCSKYTFWFQHYSAIVAIVTLCRSVFYLNSSTVQGVVKNLPIWSQMPQFVQLSPTEIRNTCFKLIMYIQTKSKICFIFD